jgi:[phosphatase 2A protein]-leucine-carboxy methyltransferase
MERFTRNGCSGAGAVNAWHAWEDLPAQIKSKVEKIEFLDEYEIMKQLLEHYCVSWGWRDESGVGIATIGLV